MMTVDWVLSNAITIPHTHQHGDKNTTPPDTHAHEYHRRQGRYQRCPNRYQISSTQSPSAYQYRGESVEKGAPDRLVFFKRLKLKPMVATMSAPTIPTNINAGFQSPARSRKQLRFWVCHITDNQTRTKTNPLIALINNTISFRIIYVPITSQLNQRQQMTTDKHRHKPCQT